MTYPAIPPSASGSVKPDDAQAKLDAIAARGGAAAGPSGLIPWEDRVIAAGEDANDRRSGGKPVTVTSQLTKEQALAKFNDLPVEQQQALGASLYKAGVISNPADFGQVLNAWESAVKMADNAATAGKPISPWAAINMMLTYGAAASNGNLKDLPKTRTDRNVTIPDPSDAEGLVKGIFQQELGRDPTPAQLAKYKSLVMGAAQKGTSSTTQNTYDAHGNVIATSTVGSGPVDYKQIVTDKVQADPEYGAYQSATTYFNAMLKAIASPV